MKYLLSLSLLLSLVCSPFIQAQETIRTGKDHALFFVVSDFDHWHNFQASSVKQVKDIEKELKLNYGFKTEFLLNPTRREILTKLTEYQQRRFSKADQLLVYFSTHGHYEESGTGALIPKDGLLEDPVYDTWITHPLLADLVNRIPCEHILLSIDACYSGTFGGSKGKPGKKPWEKADDCASKVEKALQYRSRLYLTSGGVERTPTDSQFADKWLEALRVSNSEGVLSYYKLFSVLGNAYPRPRFGVFREHEPGGDFIFVNKDFCKNSTTNDSESITHNNSKRLLGPKEQNTEAANVQPTNFPIQFGKIVRRDLNSPANHYVKKDDRISIALKGTIKTKGGMNITFEKIEGFYIADDPDVLTVTTEAGIDYPYHLTHPDVSIYLHYIRKIVFLDEIEREVKISEEKNKKCRWRKLEVTQLDGQKLTLYQSITDPLLCGGDPQRELTLIDGPLRRKIKPEEISEVQIDHPKKEFQPHPVYRGGSVTGTVVLSGGTTFDFYEIRGANKATISFTEGTPSASGIENAVKNDLDVQQIESIIFDDVITFQGEKNNCAWKKVIVKLKDYPNTLRLYLRSHQQWMMAYDCGPSADRMLTVTLNGVIIKYLPIDLIKEVRFN